MIYETGFYMLEAALGLLIGAMIFFPTVVVPTVFTVLNEKDGGRFLRALFPRYYVFIIAASTMGLVGSFLLPHHAIAVFIFALTSASTLWVLRWLVPMINAWRDQDLAGDEAAGAKFKIGHRISVIINMVQLISLIALALHV